MSKAQQVADKLNTFLGGELGNEAAALLREQDALLRQALDALHRVDAVERGMVTTKRHHYAAREETTSAITTIEEHLK